MAENVNDNSDFMSRECDKQLQKIERKISSVYKGAKKELSERLNKETAKFKAKEAEMKALVSQGYLTDADFEAWRKKALFNSVGLKSSIKGLTKILTDADKTAMATVNGELPFVIAQSFNFTQALGWKEADEAGYTLGTFEIYNANAVRKLIKDNPRLLPEVDIEKDLKWNMDKITKQVTQSIVSGDDIPTLSKKIQAVAAMDENTAVRTARTAMTYAENTGRDESFKNLKAKGLPVVKRWNAVIDNRTRFTHKLLNGTFANAEGYFGEGILNPKRLLRCPGDPNGEAWEIYNCRCRCGVVFENSVVDHSKDDEAYEEFLKKNYPNDYEKLKDKDYFNQHTSKAKQYEKPVTKPRKKKETPEEVKPTYKTVSNRKEAKALLSEMGFGNISSGVNKIDEQLFVDNVNRLSMLNSRFGAVTQDMEFKTSKMNAIASVGYQLNHEGSVYLKLSTNFFNGDPSILKASAERSRQNGFWMPFDDNNKTIYSLTHEYGHILQNKLALTAERAKRVNDSRYSGYYVASTTIQAVKEEVKKEKRKHRLEIIAIATENNPKFNLRDYLSRYGWKDDEEFFAETFANAFCGDPNELGKAMLIWLERNGL